jgi:hypothetical protein
MSTAAEQLDRDKPKDEQADWTMAFIDHSAEDRRPLEDIWDEVELNFLVRPPHESALASSTRHPLAFIRQDLAATASGYSVLKDPETHQEVMTIVANIVLALFPREGFIKTKGRGFEDIAKSTTVTELLRYDHALPGHYWEFCNWVLRATTYGTSILEAFWDYREEPRTLRALAVDEMTGEEESSSYIALVPVWDDVRYIALDHRNFYPDPGADTMLMMQGAAVHDKIDARSARALGRSGVYDKAAVKRAVEWTAGRHRAAESKSRTDQTLGTHEKRAHPDFLELDRYRYVGNVPWKAQDGIQKREIVVLGGETVRSEPWPRRLPWFDVGLIPRPGGSFWKMGPAEVVRHDQDFIDTLKMMLADAVVRMVHPSPLVADGAILNLEQFRTQRPDRPIVVEGDPNNAVAWPNFNPPIQPAFQMWSGTKQQMREGTGALGGLQGLGLGTKRFSGTEAASTFRQVYERPELFASVIERGPLPDLAQYSLELNQEYLEDTPALKLRVGESSTGAVLADILPQFDIEYIGSRQLTEQQEAEAFREIVALGANPAIAPLIPWVPLLQKYFRRLGADEIAAMVGNPELVQIHLLLARLAVPQSAAGNGNGEVPAQPPLGALPAQLAGGIQ